MQYEFITTSSIQTKKLGELLAKELCGGPPRLTKTSLDSTKCHLIESQRAIARRREEGVIICLSGDLGAGKTTFTQGLLKGLKIKGPYTSPTFAILKQYNVSSRKYNAKEQKSIIHPTKYIIHNVYHIDAYRISSKDLLELGFKDFAGKENTVTIIEWPEKVEKIIPPPPAGGVLWVNFEWLSEKERKITLS